MSKIVLITHPTDLTSFNATYLEPILDKYFTVVYYDRDLKYPKSSVAIVGKTNNNWYTKLNTKIAIVNLWEKDKQRTNFPCFNIANKNWFWYNESLWYKKNGYDLYIPNKQYTHTAFMQMRLQKPNRDKLLNKLQPYLDNMIYSYVAKGIYLPKDLPHDLDTLTGNFQRNFNPLWYDNTYYSIVAETHIDDTTIFPTEKTFKPIAFLHPFMILGQFKILSYIKSLGFATFDNLFDESYDNVKNYNLRIDNIVENVKNFILESYSKETVDKLNHNKELFFNQKIVEQRIVNEIINPLIEYAET